MNRNSSLPTWGTRLVRFFYERSRWLFGKKLSKIDLPSRASIQVDFFSREGFTGGELTKKISHQFVKTEELSKVSSVRDSVIPPVGISKQTLEMYAMKIIAMLERRAIAPHNDSRALVKQAPISATLLPQEQMCILSQTLSPFPGQTIEVQGGFRHDPRTQVFGLPVTDSFKLSVKSIQTGFPYPAQVYGWTLADPLIPCSPSHLEKTPLLQYVLECKKGSSLALQPSSPLLTKARRFLKLKEEAFNLHKKSGLSQHNALAHALCNHQEYDQSSIDQFFESLTPSENPYQLLSNTYQMFNLYFIDLPMQAFNLWRLKVVLDNVHPDDIYKISRQVLVKNTNIQKEALVNLSRQTHILSDKACYLYLLELEKALSPSIHTIFLQHQSEILNFPTPKLSLQAKKLQVALYNHVIQLHQEFQLDPENMNIFQYLTDLLSKDISLFESKEVPAKSSIIEELEAYFSKSCI